MGVDCEIWLPDRVRDRDVAIAIGGFAGLDVTLEPLGRDSVHAVCPEIKLRGYEDLPCIAAIESTVVAPVFGRQFHVIYHYQPSDRPGRLLMPRSYSPWLAIGHGLVNFFGGDVIYKDCDESGPDYTVPWRPVEETSPCNGNEWERFMQRLAAIEAVDPAPFRKFAAYT